MTHQNPELPDDGSALAGGRREQAFLAQLDHDLRTPLGTMAAALELLREEPLGTSLHTETIAVLQRQVNRLHLLTDRIHEFLQSSDR